MPRGPRLDGPGALHHVMVRGIERRALFRDDRDRADCVTRLATVVKRTGLDVLAWALLPNHFHLLVRTPRRALDPRQTTLAPAMRRLLTGYAVAFNRRHQRTGHLVQNRYKSVLVEEEPYLLELVRYLHLNPVRAGLVAGLSDLGRYPWSGHSALMGRVARPWQAVDEVLARFGSTPRIARRRYQQFVREGLDRGRRPELQGGGLRRSLQGWQGVAILRRGRERWATDERVLGSGPFVESVLREMVSPRRALPPIQARDALPLLLEACAKVWGVSAQEIEAGGRRHAVAHARAAVAMLAVTYMGLSAAGVARRLGVTPVVVLRGVERGPRLFAGRGVDPSRVVASLARGRPRPPAPKE